LCVVEVKGSADIGRQGLEKGCYQVVSEVRQYKEDYQPNRERTIVFLTKNDYISFQMPA